MEHIYLQTVTLTKEGSTWSTLNKATTSYCLRSSLVTEAVTNLPAMQETWVRSLDWEDTLEKGMPTHSCVLPGESLWTEESGGLQSMGSQRVGHN